METRQDFDARLRAELEKAEGQKAAVMALLVFLAVVPVLGVTLPRGQFLEQASLRPGLLGVFTLFCLLVLAVEVLAWLLIRRRTRAGLPLRRWPGFLLVGIEALTPTFGLMLLGSYLPPAYALTAPQTLLYGIFIVSSTLRLDPRLCLVSGAVASGSYALFAAWLVRSGQVELALEREPLTHVMRSVFILLIGVGSALIAWQVRRRVQAALMAALERNRVVGVFGRYLSDEVVEHLLHSPDGLRLGGQRREISVMLTDLRGFSTVAEELPPERVVVLLNHYLGRMIPIIVAHGGTLDEIIGDALLVLFNAPLVQQDHPRRAVACALAMQQEMEAVNAWNREQGLPDLEMGIGLHAGEVVVGNIGSDQRQKYGVVGSTINMAARVEAATVGGQVLATERLVAAVGPGLELGERRSLRPKGARAPVEVVELLGLDGQRLSPAQGALEECPPSPLLLWALHGKELDPEPISALVIARAPRALRVRSEAPLDGLGDVQVELRGERAYARVSAEPGGALLRIASAEGAARLEAAWRATAAELD